ncbi:hypothetical protein [Paenibacillus sp. Soil724D2]|uniref:hypothetical protein n=1 Tax=Paenibacillus sp. (strain Soil724D2) TaxID=1736392 RepID=UPI0007160C76|nr:hypothetical protein [Paenibacillus sp. Soil724D2]KRE33262.1 hypothetical protein ASG85_13355 [Paenibacillus sp. Soil724D2]
MSFISPQWLKDYFKGWTDDDLFDRHREITSFGGNESEKMMIEMESKRRETEHGNKVANS